MSAVQEVLARKAAENAERLPDPIACISELRTVRDVLRTYGFRDVTDRAGLPMDGDVFEVICFGFPGQYDCVIDTKARQPFQVIDPLGIDPGVPIMWRPKDWHVAT